MSLNVFRWFVCIGLSSFYIGNETELIWTDQSHWQDTVNSVLFHILNYYRDIKRTKAIFIPNNNRLLTKVSKKRRNVSFQETAGFIHTELFWFPLNWIFKPYMITNDSSKLFWYSVYLSKQQYLEDFARSVYYNFLDCVEYYHKVNVALDSFTLTSLSWPKR